MNIVLSFQRNVPKCLNHRDRPSTTMAGLSGDDYLYCAECNYKNSSELSNLKKAVPHNDDYPPHNDDCPEETKKKKYKTTPGKRQMPQRKNKKSLMKEFKEKWEK